MARILVADDSPSVRIMVVRQLQSDGHSVVEAADGTTAEQIGIDEEIDAAILDQLMPGRLGTDVLHRWRSEGIDIPVLLLSAVDDDVLIARVLEMGAADYVRKPFNVGVLKARLSRLL